MANVRSVHLLTSTNFCSRLAPAQYYMLDCSGQADCDDSGRLVARSYLFLAGLAAAVRVALNVQTLHCYKNFGFGLTDRGESWSA